VIHVAARLQSLYPAMVQWNPLCYWARMKFCLFYHSLVSDWNHGNAHFLRGVASELMGRGHSVRVFEPRDGWSRSHLLAQSPAAIKDFGRAFPHLSSELYDTRALDLDAMLDGADVVIVHEWTEPEVLSAVANHRKRQGPYGLLFHDTHHRAVSDPDALAQLPLERFDGVLAFGAALAERYRRLGWGQRVWVWHEAADVRIARPGSATTAHRRGAPTATDPRGAATSHADRRDLVWVGNWGDGERARELDEYLLEPVRQLRLNAEVWGVRYPADALERLRRTGISYGGWIPNHRVPDVFARASLTVHIPRAPYVSMLPGIPTIRVFEALACGIPLISAPWDDCERLFRADDFIMVRDGGEMTDALARVRDDRALAAELSARGLETIAARHTCAHRVDELLGIIAGARLGPARNHTIVEDRSRTQSPAPSRHVTTPVTSGQVIGKES
jgi:spore maturation protein CgeB